MAYCRNGNIFKRDDTPNAANECLALRSILHRYNRKRLTILETNSDV